MVKKQHSTLSRLEVKKKKKKPCKWLTHTGSWMILISQSQLTNVLITFYLQINMKTMPTSMFRLLIGQETPVYIWYDDFSEKYTNNSVLIIGILHLAAILEIELHWALNVLGDAGNVIAITCSTFLIKNIPGVLIFQSFLKESFLRVFLFRFLCPLCYHSWFLKWMI